MRGRRGSSSSSVSQEHTRMALRKQTVKDVPCGSQTSDDSTQEDEALDDRDDNDDFSSSLLSPSSSRGKRRRERENKSNSQEMTEEEMMDLALRLSKQEASVTALQLQKEEEAMMKAIQESMVTQPCPSSQSQSLLSDTEASLRLCSRRKLKYPNGKRVPAINQETEETDPKQGAKGNPEESSSRNRKRKRKEGSPLLEMPDLSQTQKIISQDSLCSSEPRELLLDSSSDSTQIDDCEFRKSPVFPLTGCRTAEVHVPRLSQDLLDTCRTSGFVLCSQDGRTSPPKPPTSVPPKNHKPSLLTITLSDSPVLSMDEDAETPLSLDQSKSPVFGKNIQHEASSSACRPKVGVFNSGFTLSSQESLTSSSCRSKSPVFPRSPGHNKTLYSLKGSLQSSETDRGRTEQRYDNGTSPVFDLTEQNQRITSTFTQDVDDAESQKEISKQQTSSEVELTSDMTLIWSEEDEDVTLEGSPSPVFPEETPVHQAPVTAASPGRTGLNHRPFSSASEESKKESAPVRHQGALCSASAQPQEPAVGPTVHYYWGIPFCPRGLDPDSYTQVILAQMEVYEKSLKQAQRSLMRKAEWGDAILPQLERSPSPECPSPETPPQPVRRRGGLRLKGKKLCEVRDSPPSEAEEEEEGKGKREEEEKEERTSKDEEQKEKKTEVGGGELVDVDDCEVCPETQLSNDDDDDRTQDLMMETEATEEISLHPKSPDFTETIHPDKSPAGDETQDEDMEVEVDDPVDRKTEANSPVSSSDFLRQNKREREEKEEEREDPDVQDVDDGGLLRSVSPEVETPVDHQVPEGTVDCPICQRSFPLTEIELHAAYCDGEVAEERTPEEDCYHVTVKTRRKGGRRPEAMTEESHKHSNTSQNHEKCYICQKKVPAREFSRHTTLCLQRQSSTSAAKGNLLSALDQTDSRDSEAGPSGSKMQPGDIIDLLDDDDDDEDEGEEEKGGGGHVASATTITDSPIRSFTSISEATDCLIDFRRKPQTKKLRQRRR